MFSSSLNGTSINLCTIPNYLKWSYPFSLGDKNVYFEYIIQGYVVAVGGFMYLFDTWSSEQIDKSSLFFNNWFRDTRVEIKQSIDNQN